MVDFHLLSDFLTLIFEGAVWLDSQIGIFDLAFGHSQDALVVVGRVVRAAHGGKVRGTTELAVFWNEQERGESILYTFCLLAKIHDLLVKVK